MNPKPDHRAVLDTGHPGGPSTTAGEHKRARLTPTPLVMLLGPTASGKSAAAMAMARRFPIEIISVDSASVYRGLDVGTAKPTAQERSRVPHHLIDCSDPWTPYSAARFVGDARRLISEITARGSRPLLVGGTMLYARALMQGLDDLPVADPQVREQIEARAARDGWPALHAELAAIDPVTAARLAPRDAQRIQRALEVAQITGSPMSSLLASARPRRGAPDDAEHWNVITLEPSSRAILHERIGRRFEQMLANGLVAEVEQLRRDTRIVASLPAMRSVGYRQVWQMLDGEIPADEMAARGIVATRQLAKRQLTWLRSMTGRVVLDCTPAVAAEKVHAELAAILERIWV